MTDGADTDDAVSIAVTGATGRMGRTVLETAADREDVTVVLAVNRDPDEAAIEGLSIEPADDLSALLAERNPDVLVDFTGPSSSLEYVAACAEAGVAAVVGTTGFDEDERAALREAGETIALLQASNFSRGIQVLLGVVGEAVAALPEYDIELTETHHNRKRDAPSGTARTILDRIDDVRGEHGATDEDRRSSRVYGREGEQPRERGEIGVHVRRAGDVRGEHEVLLAGDDEVFSVTHCAGSRRVFASGALAAAVRLAEREPGYYNFAEVLEGT